MSKVSNVIETVVSVKDNFTPNLNRFNNTLKGNVNGLNKFAMAGKTSMIAGAALGGVLAKTVLDASRFEKAMSEVKAISGASGREFDLLKDKAREMGSKTSYSAK